MIVTAEDFLKYENPDPRCTYPFEADPLGYCWSYAHHVDGKAGFENMEAHCRNCDCWNETGKPASVRELRQQAEERRKGGGK